MAKSIKAANREVREAFARLKGERMDPKEALLKIQRIMSGTEWSPDTHDEIVVVMEQAGYPIEDLEE
jgi:hypothetical protein